MGKRCQRDGQALLEGRDYPAVAQVPTLAIPVVAEAASDFAAFGLHIDFHDGRPKRMHLKCMLFFCFFLFLNVE